MSRVLISLKHLVCSCFHLLQNGFLRWTRPQNTSLLLGTLVDLAEEKSELVAKNALFRQQLIILRRQVKRPTCRKTDRFRLLILARMMRTWKQALFINDPEIHEARSHVRLSRPRGQKWATFLHNHAADIWACGFLQVTDFFFRSFLN